MTTQKGTACVIQINDPEMAKLLCGEVPEPSKCGATGSARGGMHEDEEPSKSREASKEKKESAGWLCYVLWGAGILLGLVVLFVLWRFVASDDDQLDEIPQEVEARYANVRKKIDRIREQLRQQADADTSRDTDPANEKPNILDVDPEGQSARNISMLDSEERSLFEP